MYISTTIKFNLRFGEELELIHLDQNVKLKYVVGWGMANGLGPWPYPIQNITELNKTVLV